MSLTEQEQRLADWLERAAPEPPRTLTIDDVPIDPHLPLRVAPGSHRRWTPLLAAAAVIGVVAASAVAITAAHHARSGARPLASSAATTPANPSVKGPQPPANLASMLLIGSNGSMAWELMKSAVRITQDAGEHWSSVPLPTGLTGSSVTSIAGAPDRGLWLTTASESAVGVYHLFLSNTWSSLTLTPIRPNYVGSGTPIATVSLGAGSTRGPMDPLQPNGMVIVQSGWDLSQDTSYNILFVSSDDGRTFPEDHINIGEYLFGPVVFSDHLHGVAVAGPSTLPSKVYRTDDGGITWKLVDIDTEPPQATFGALALDGTSVEVPMVVTDPRGAHTVTILRSSDGGATFTATGSALRMPTDRDPGRVEPGIVGDDVWMPAKGVIYESHDGGRTWITVTTDAQMFLISPIDATKATGVAIGPGCNGGSATCLDATFLVATDDGGATWHTI